MKLNTHLYLMPESRMLEVLPLCFLFNFLLCAYTEATLSLSLQYLQSSCF